ncbi:MAG: DUF2779 domain-containing protein [Halobacteriovoraceae bacterium]|nr:DUF2779 domain-containing protein [Halobacteriovoraceae bacterium]MCB9093481.1 DUF2779 domain-containing protein [Halobacteriovoraceae bacterium]
MKNRKGKLDTQVIAGYSDSNKMRYLTKSRFKIALECPTKLYYNEHKDKYANSKLDDPFLEALAKGGFQVGELAKCYYPNGHDITELDYETSEKKTLELLKLDEVVIFEAAIRYKNLFIRIDILEKKGNTFNLIEVKSKSAHPQEFEDELWNSRELKRGIHSLKNDWKSYLYDVAFQSFVLKQAFPDYRINNYLMCADKSKVATVDGLNQKFVLVNNKGRTGAVPKGDISEKALGDQILCKLPVNEIIEIIHNDEEMSERFDGRGFEGAIWYFADALSKDLKLETAVGSKCKSCEFRTNEAGKECGFNECWKQQHGLNAEDLSKPFAFDVWNFRGAQKAIDDNRFLMEDLDANDLKIDQSKSGEGLSNGERQLLQIEKIKDQDSSSYIDINGLQEEMSSWEYPLHMIDFETCMVAIPFNKGQRPYEQIAFQFSHHIIYEDGSIEHANEYINATQGLHPNFEFVRELKNALGNRGSIFRYSNHENTVLCQIREQLLNSDVSDRDELISFIETITSKKNGKKILWEGKRSMIDLCEMVKKYYYSPYTKGSNSIKYVLPAILNESKYIQEKYSNAIYGKNCEIRSKNFDAHTWITFDKSGSVINPYDTLPPIFDLGSVEKIGISL